MKTLTAKQRAKIYREAAEARFNLKDYESGVHSADLPESSLFHYTNIETTIYTDLTPKEWAMLCCMCFLFCEQIALNSKD